MGKELGKSARTAELFAINNLAYGIAQDLAAGIETSAPLEPVAVDYARILEESIGKREDEENLPGYKDSYAFVELVTQCRKVNPDMQRLRNARLLAESIVGHLAANPPRNREERSIMKQARAHLEAARQCAPQ